MNNRTNSFVRLVAVNAHIGLVPTVIYRRMALGVFPGSMLITPGLVGWYEADIDAWISNPLGWRAAAAPEPCHGFRREIKGGGPPLRGH